MLFFILLVPVLFASEAENQSITFALPQAFLMNPELRENAPVFNLDRELLYDFSYLFQGDSKKFIQTSIGPLGIITTSIDNKSRSIGISYLSLPKRSSSCEISFPQELPQQEASECALQIVVLPGKRGPQMLKISLSLKDGGVSKELFADLKGATLILIPLSLFEISDVAAISSLNIIVPSAADRDGIGSYTLRDMRIVFK